MTSQQSGDISTGLGLLLAGAAIAFWGMRGPRNIAPDSPRRPRSTAAFIGGLGLVVFAVAQIFRAMSPAPEAAWVPFQFAAGNYSVTFPTQPQIKESDQQIEGHTFHMTSTRAMGSDGRCEFRVTFTDHPSGSLGPGALDSIKERMLANGIKPIVDRKVMLGDTKGCELAIPVNEQKLLARSRIFIVGDRSYTVMVVGLEDQIMSADATRFLDSFSLGAR